MKTSRGHMAKPDIARMMAVTLITDVMENAKLLSDLTFGPKFLSLSPPERARAQRLATECLRSVERADRILSKIMRKAPPLFVQNALRLGTVELCTGGDAHGIVND
ncbi:MAG: transcription antitermination factor NusB, partial [Paracoccaceae bacterium]